MTHINSPSFQPAGGREGEKKLQWVQRMAFYMNTKIAFMSRRLYDNILILKLKVIPHNS